MPGRSKHSHFTPNDAIKSNVLMRKAFQADKACFTNLDCECRNHIFCKAPLLINVFCVLSWSKLKFPALCNFLFVLSFLSNE